MLRLCVLCALCVLGGSCVVTSDTAQTPVRWNRLRALGQELSRLHLRQRVQVRKQLLRGLDAPRRSGLHARDRLRLGSELEHERQGARGLRHGHLEPGEYVTFHRLEPDEHALGHDA